MIKRSQKVFYALSLLVYDIALLSVAYLAAFYARQHLEVFRPIQPFAEYMLPILMLIAICVSFMFLQGLYRDIRDLSMVEEYAKIIKSLTYAFLVAIALTFFFKLYERSRVLVVLYWLIANAFMVAGRFLYYHLIKKLRARGWNTLAVAIVGSEKKVKAIRQLLAHHLQLGYRIVAEVILPRGVSPRSDNLRKKIDYEILSRYQRGEINGVIVSDTVKNYQHILEVNEIFKEYGIPYRNVTEAFDLTGFKTIPGQELETLFSSLDEGQIGGGYKVLKRFFDEIISIFLLIISAPLWCLIMLAIKLDSPGPIFFRQERVGYLGRKFKIFKFRSMHVHAPKYAHTPRSQGDPRVTRVGAFLRKTSLDELPQLINVILGDMSMVGPRPEMPFIVEKYKPIYRYRLLLLPGLSGLWQVSGRSDKPLEENIKYDLYYIKHQSLLLDLVILLRTVPAVLFRKGAY